ncbi:MAG: 5'-deoxynucleotidase YfbR-like HD superfamily hydrolase, partial [Gammaproteobacteria bacterium]
MQEFAPLETLLKTIPLGDLPRTGWIQAGLGDVESVAAHSHGVCLLVLTLASEVN